MIELPTTKRAATQVHPKFAVFIGQPKSGKTTIMAQLPNNLIIDLENGTDYYDAMVVKATNIDELSQIAASIAASEHKYDYITIDTASVLDEMVLPLAAMMYLSGTTCGKATKDEAAADPNWRFKFDVREMPNGAGYLFHRNAFKAVIQKFMPLPTRTLILIAHAKDKQINIDGRDLDEIHPDLTGKLHRLIPSQADAVGLVYRQGKKTILTFEGGGSAIVESRTPHLRNKKFVVAESDKEGKLTVNWDEIFPAD